MKKIISILVLIIFVMSACKKEDSDILYENMWNYDSYHSSDFGTVNVSGTFSFNDVYITQKQKEVELTYYISYIIQNHFYIDSIIEEYNDIRKVLIHENPDYYYFDYKLHKNTLELKYYMVNQNVIRTWNCN